MQDFDQIAEQEDREFKLRGETFRIARTRPETLAQLREIEEQLEKGTNGKPVEITHELIAKVFEERILLLLDPPSVERWKALREREDDPISYTDIMAISRWAQELTTGFPTMPADSSASGPTKTAASSKAESR